MACALLPYAPLSISRSDWAVLRHFAPCLKFPVVVDALVVALWKRRHLADDERLSLVALRSTLAGWAGLNHLTPHRPGRILYYIPSSPYLLLHV
jgi:hypothetical protein